jgi:hypothetical protein
MTRFTQQELDHYADQLMDVVPVNMRVTYQKLISEAAVNGTDVAEAFDGLAFGWSMVHTMLESYVAGTQEQDVPLHIKMAMTAQYAACQALIVDPIFHLLVSMAEYLRSGGPT